MLLFPILCIHCCPFTQYNGVHHSLGSLVMLGDKNWSANWSKFWVKMTVEPRWHLPPYLLNVLSVENKAVTYLLSSITQALPLHLTQECFRLFLCYMVCASALHTRNYLFSTVCAMFGDSVFHLSPADIYLCRFPVWLSDLLHRWPPQPQLWPVRLLSYSQPCLHAWPTQCVLEWK